MNILQYKGVFGTIEYSAEDACLIGELLNTDNAVIVYEGQSIEEITEMFHQAVDGYLELCQERNLQAENQYEKEDLQVHLDATLHKNAIKVAQMSGQSLKDFIVNAVEKAVANKF